jgi:hypothetical protein
MKAEDRLRSAEGIILGVVVLALVIGYIVTLLF